MVCAVSFTRYGRLYYADPGDLAPAVGDLVLYPTDAGPEVAECVWGGEWVSDVDGLPVLTGRATESDLRKDADSRTRRAEAKVAAKRLVRQYALPMKVVGVDWTARDSTLTLYFTAPERVDFRDLLRDLTRTLATRVHLTQLMDRDSARVQGGIGSCGRDLCCATFLREFEPVSVRMAKDQNLPTNPMRISGACGRLMCCLKYEHPLYQEFAATAPAVGTEIETDQGSARVVGHDVPRDEIVVRMAADGRRTSCSKAGVCGSRQAFETRSPE